MLSTKSEFQENLNFLRLKKIELMLTVQGNQAITKRCAFAIILSTCHF